MDRAEGMVDEGGLPQGMEENLQPIIQSLYDQGLTKEEIREQINQLMEQQTGVTTDDWKAAKKPDKGVFTEEIPTGNTDENGNDVYLQIKFKEPRNVTAVLSKYIQAQSEGGRVEREAQESIIYATLIEPEPLKVFSNHLEDNELERYEDPEDDDHPEEWVDSWWDTTPAFRVTAFQKILAKIGYNADFIQAFMQTAIGKEERQQISSMMSQQNLDSILSSLDESSSEDEKKGMEAGTQETSSSPGSKPSVVKPSDGDDGSKTSDTSSATSSDKPSQEQTTPTSSTKKSEKKSDSVNEPVRTS